MEIYYGKRRLGTPTPSNWRRTRLKVIFVCTGNICRSPTAEAVFRHLVEEAGLMDQVAIDSAGTHGYHVGESPDRRTATAAAKRGYSLAGQTARQIDEEDFERFDLLLAMDRGHRTFLNRIAPPGSEKKVRMFMSLAAGKGDQDVPDPYYGGPDGFEIVLDMIEAGGRGLLAVLAARVRV